tara:strand:+ start:74 stop:415 length:342 start_codon:yes stop_codon:yes gene_type:complete
MFFNALKLTDPHPRAILPTMSGITPPRLTTKSFSICYYDGNTGEVISNTAFFNNTGKVKDSVQSAIDCKPEYDGLVLWDINIIEEEEEGPKQRKISGFDNTGNHKTPTTNEIA